MCKLGPEECWPAKQFYNWAKYNKPILGSKLSRLGPILICCKDNTARLLRLSNSGNDLIPFVRYPFKFIEKPLYHIDLE